MNGRKYKYYVWYVNEDGEELLSIGTDSEVSAMNDKKAIKELFGFYAFVRLGKAHPNYFWD